MKKKFFKDIPPRDFWNALRAYLRQEKTRFDLRDRARLLIFMALAIILLQKVVEWLGSCYNIMIR